MANILMVFPTMRHSFFGNDPTLQPGRLAFEWFNSCSGTGDETQNDLIFDLPDIGQNQTRTT
jgi:hypothetical protein